VRTSRIASAAATFVVRVATYLPLVFLVLGLASRSTTSSPVFLGKSRGLWALIVALAVLQLVVLAVFRRLSEGTRRQLVFTAIASVVFFEVAAFSFARYLPIVLLLQQPDWVLRLLPERAFERPNYRMLQRSETPDDPELGFRHAPRLNVFIQWGELRYHLVTDSQGFANTDETLYKAADVVMTGGSFTMGTGVEFPDSWPQGVAHRTGRRVLNLAANGWDVYQYPRVVARYAPAASPRRVVVALTMINTLSDRYYRYEDYRAAHPDVTGYHDFVRRVPSVADRRTARGNYLQSAAEFTRLAMPFTMTAVMYFSDDVMRPSRPCDFRLAGRPIRVTFDTQSWRTAAETGEAFGVEGKYFPRLARDLAAIADVAKTMGATMHVVYLPSPEEVYVPLLEAAEQRDACAQALYERYRQGAFDLERSIRTYTRALDGTGITLVNLREYLQSSARRGEQLVWTTDHHPNVLGNRRIAEAVLELTGLGAQR
jgi:hypothetical protein